MQYSSTGSSRGGQSCRAPTRVEELLHDATLAGGQALVQVAHAVGQRLLQGGVVDLLQEGRQVLLRAVQEPSVGDGVNIHSPVPASVSQVNPLINSLCGKRFGWGISVFFYLLKCIVTYKWINSL